MTLRLRPWFGFLAFLAGTSSAFAQAIPLSEDIKQGDLHRYELSLTVEGRLKVERDGKPDTIPLAARASHKFVERVEAPDARGGIGIGVRYYEAATSRGDTGGDVSSRELGADRRVIVAQRTAEGTLHYSPEGPLSRDELDLVAEHFDTLGLAALLPGKEVKVGDTWVLTSDAAQHACLFEGLVKSELTGKLESVKDNLATFRIGGTAEGLESGAQIKVKVSAVGTFDVATRRVVALTWEQVDDRGQGPASPASEVKAVLELKRASVTDEPKELAAGRAKIPADGKVPELLTMLRYGDPSGRYNFVHHREWRMVGRTKDHLVLRLLDKGEFAAQATITAWKKADPGQHSSPEEFKRLLGQLPGWEPEQILADGALPTDGGRWLYRVVARGKQDGIAVVQSFYLLAGPQGNQVAFTVLARAEKAPKIGERDLMIVNAIEFPAAK